MKNLMRWLRLSGALALALMLCVLCMSAEARVRGTPARFEGALKIKTMTAPGTPPSGWLYAYVKSSDGLLYAKDSSGNEYCLSTNSLSSKTLVSPVISTGLTASGSASNDFSGSTGAFKTSTGVNTMGGECDLVAGTTAVAPLKYTAGTNLATATAGACEYDGTALYDTAVANSRQVRRDEQVLYLNAAYTLTSTTNQQKLFNVPTNGALTLAAATTYAFECYVGMSSMSATSGNCKFSPAGLGLAGGTATITKASWDLWGLDATTPGTAAAIGGCNYAGTTADPISTGDAVVAATGTGMYFHATGIIRTNAAGTIVPAVSLTTAATPTVDVGSYFRIWPVGTNTVTTVGNWN